jgi:hypothetical protein
MSAWHETLVQMVIIYIIHYLLCSKYLYVTGQQKGLHVVCKQYANLTRSGRIISSAS